VCKHKDDTKLPIYLPLCLKNHTCSYAVKTLCIINL